MRVAVVTETWRPHVDGVVTRLQHTVEDLTRRGHQVLVVAPTCDESSSGVIEHRTPGAVVPLIDRARRWGAPDPMLRRHVERFGPDVVHIVNPVLMGSVAACQLRGRYPLVASLHTDLDAYTSRYRLGLLRPTLRRLTSSVYGRADVVLATSPTGVGLVSALGRRDAVIWPAGIDEHLLDALTAPAEGGPRTHHQPRGSMIRALCVGRLAREKDYDVLVPVLRAPGVSSEISLTFVGDGPDRIRLERRFAGTAVSFDGVHRGSGLAAYYRQADVLIFTSTTDTVGLVLLEAAAAELPIVAVDTPSTRDALQDYHRIILVPLRCEPRAWRVAIRSAASMRWEACAPRSVASWHASTEVLLDAYATARDRHRERHRERPRMWARPRS
ncbi:MAG: glycosyltransferase [Propionibacteriaceae bacterium]